jgi:Na+-driven multidrug efflux pump
MGAGRPDRADQVIRTGLRWNLWMSGWLTLLLWAFPTTFLHWFTHDPEALRVGVPYLRILTLCLVVNGMEIVVSESIIGSGHTRAISWIFSSFSLLRIPLALWSPAWGMGVLGIAWIITDLLVGADHRGAGRPRHMEVRTPSRAATRQGRKGSPPPSA